ncbi:SusC/RagA family TonB-linked outer membrane protein [Alkalitalea saponilacus]|uniref:TonB-linked outer membrane protein, SusC/RagA family n=1 Tax=Alkalitalea saponilacus TaxID=889453 RepID=A0A1T5EUV2_9BACT|nr:SusC/RagA family TonB-linked outer membrane protein [Alkalitalea saponilacus]ASB48021.1 SusC/RagA family TonB-linked outer membrane protein [Alkalitalea saponilacus]SKB87725.1 TonB-linked outer membrane protein, SusC/RagA family [Alkalitalea saponilacus]
MNYIKRIFISLVVSCTAVIGWGQHQSAGEDIIVTGVVYSATTLQPIAFADVSCGNFSSDFSGIEGEFSIRVRSLEDVLTFESLGYHTTDVVLAGRDNVDVYMQEVSNKSFQQATNVGYYNIKEAYTPRSSASTNRLSERSKSGNTSPEKEFGTFAAGLQIKERTGITGIGSDLFLRGFNSLNATNQPLIIVDGMIYDITNYGNPLIDGYRTNPLGGIDLGDIENVTVIRDAVPIYGAKAANGVILITTSRANRQATSIDFQMHGGIHMKPEVYPLMSAEQYKPYLSEMFLSAGYTPGEVSQMPYFTTSPQQTGFYRMNNDINWQREVFNQSYSSNYSLRIKGGDDVALYSLGVGYMHQGGMVEDSDFSRFNLRFNSDINFSPRLTLNSNISFVYNDNEIGATGYNSPDDVVAQARLKAPFMHPYIISEEGRVSALFEDYDGLGISNPLAILDNHTLRGQNYRFFGSFDFNYQVNDNLTISNLIGLSFDKDRETLFIPSHGIEPITTPLGTITNKMGARVMRHMAVNNDFRALYNNRFGYAHGIMAVAGVRMNINNIEEDWGRGYSSANDNLRTLSHSLGVLRQKGGFSGAWNSLTMYLSGDYDYKHKYFLNLSMAIDGSSRFGSEADGLGLMGSVFGFFPSVAGAWLLTSEPFLNDANSLDLLKVRASYGMTGNDDIGNYAAKRYYTAYSFLSYQGIVLGNLYNPELKWETNTKMNVGIDFAVFRERFSGSVDFYHNRTQDMIDFVPASIYSGFDYKIINDGEMTTQGMDVSLNARILNGAFRWDAGVTIGKYTTNIEKINGDRKITELYGANILTEVGQPLGVFYGFRTSGVYSSQADADNAGLQALLPNTQLMPFQAGDVIFQDVDNNGIIDNNDMQIIGDPTPDFFGEFNSRMRWKDFTLNAAVSFSVGGDVYNYQRRQLESMSGYGNQTKAVVNRWQYEGQQTNIPRANYNDDIGNSRFSDRWIEDGSFVRLRNVTLSYNVPFRPFGFQSVEVYASGNNLITFTDYKGLDPVFSAGASPLLQGIDLGMLPHATSFLFGIKIGL